MAWQTHALCSSARLSSPHWHPWGCKDEQPAAGLFREASTMTRVERAQVFTGLAALTPQLLGKEALAEERTELFQPLSLRPQRARDQPSGSLSGCACSLCPHPPGVLGSSVPQLAQASLSFQESSKPPAVLPERTGERKPLCSTPTRPRFLRSCNTPGNLGESQRFLLSSILLDKEVEDLFYI